MTSSRPQEWPDYCRCHADTTRCRLQWIGEIGIAQAAELKQLLERLGDDPRLLEIDLAEITRIDTAGVQLLMALRNHRQALKLPLHLTHHSDAVLSAYSLLDLVQYFSDPIVMTGTGGHG